MRKSNVAYELTENTDWAKVPGLRQLIKWRGGLGLGKACENCKCKRYNPCTCQKAITKGEKQ